MLQADLPEIATNTAATSSSSYAAPVACSSAAGAASSSSATPATSSSAGAGLDAAGRQSPPLLLPTAGRPQSLEPNNAPAWVPGASASSSSSTAAKKAASGSSASSAGPSAAMSAPESYSNEEDCGEILRPKVNPALSKAQHEALVLDDFLLATDLKTSKAPEKAVEADETFAHFDVALRHRDFNVAEALWKRMVSLGTASAFIPNRPDNRAIASRYVSAMHPRIQTELESAIDRKDINAAEREHQRLSDLRDSCKGTEIVDVTTDKNGKTDELERKYQQLCNKNGPLVCNLFPKVSVNGCMNQNGQETCVVL